MGNGWIDIKVLCHHFKIKSRFRFSLLSESFRLSVKFIVIHIILFKAYLSRYKFLLNSSTSAVGLRSRATLSFSKTASAHAPLTPSVMMA